MRIPNKNAALSFIVILFLFVCAPDSLLLACNTATSPATWPALEREIKRAHPTGRLTPSEHVQQAILIYIQSVKFKDPVDLNSSTQRCRAHLLHVGFLGMSCLTVADIPICFRCDMFPFS